MITINVNQNIGKIKGVLPEATRKEFKSWFDDEFTQTEQEDMYIKDIIHMKEAFKAGKELSK